MIKNFLVDVPVLVCIWIRPELQRKQFEVLRQARPSTLFLQSDGGRNENEWNSINQNRKMYDEEIDWDCKVTKIYEDDNKGLYFMLDKVMRIIWDQVDRCIFLEDDDMPSVSFFEFCYLLLKKYENDFRIDRICGMNYDGISNNVSSDYFFSKKGCIWGTATWRRTYQDRRCSMDYSKDRYEMKLLKKMTGLDKEFFSRIVGYSKDKFYSGHVAAEEFYHCFSAYGLYQLQIIPKKNMISNHGAGSNATHSDRLDLLPRPIRRIYELDTYEIELPIKHPSLIIPDTGYEKRVIRTLGYNASMITKIGRILERAYLVMRSGDVFYPIKRIYQKILILINGKKIEK